MAAGTSGPTGPMERLQKLESIEREIGTSLQSAGNIWMQYLQIILELMITAFFSHVLNINYVVDLLCSINQ